MALICGQDVVRERVGGESHKYAEGDDQGWVRVEGAQTHISILIYQLGGGCCGLHVCNACASLFYKQRVLQLYDGRLAASIGVRQKSIEDHCFTAAAVRDPVHLHDMLQNNIGHVTL
jgi:hypothetical protein